MWTLITTVTTYGTKITKMLNVELEDGSRKRICVNVWISQNLIDINVVLKNKIIKRVLACFKEVKKPNTDNLFIITF